MHGKPWRQRGFPRLFFWLQILAMLAYPCWMAWRHAVGYRGDELIGFTLVMGLFFFSPALTITINLLVYSAGWSRPDRLEELWLTPLSSREAAFGAAFWGVVAGLILPASTILGVIVGIVADPAQWLWPQYGTHYLGLVLLVVTVSATIASAALTVGHWHNFQTHRWRVIFMGAFSTFGAAIWFMIGGAVFWARLAKTVGVRDDTMFCVTVLLFAPIVIVGTIRHAGALAPTKFWSPIFRESAEELVLIWAGRPMRKNRPLKKAARAALRSFVPMHLGRQTGVLLCVGTAMIALSGMTSVSGVAYYSPESGYRTEDIPYLAKAWNVASLTITFIVCMIANTVLELRQRGDLAAVIVPGRMLVSLLRRHFVAGSAYLAFFVLGGTYTYLEDELNQAPWNIPFVLFGILIFAAFVALCFLGFQTYILSRRRMRLWLVLWSAFMLWTLWLYVAGARGSERFWYLPWRSPENELLFLLPVWVAGSFGLLAPQALHSRSISVLRASGYETSPGRIERVERSGLVADAPAEPPPPGENADPQPEPSQASDS